MSKLVFMMNASLDGFINHERFPPPGPLLFDFYIEHTRSLTGSIYGRHLYEAMHYWDGQDWEQADPAQRDALRHFAEAWRRMPKWVVSRTMKTVGPNATLIGDDVGAEVRRLKRQGDGTIAVGGPKLAASLARLDLIDEYQIILHPVVLGNGDPFFAGVQPSLRLTGSERVGESAVKLRYVPA
jgi:dihydrofolate reductase